MRAIALRALLLAVAAHFTMADAARLDGPSYAQSARTAPQ